MPLFLLAALGVGAYLLLSKSSSSGLAQLQQQSAAQANSNPYAPPAGWSDFNAQANALNLSQADAQQAYDIGLSPQEYVDSGLQGTAPGATIGPQG